MTKEKFGDFLRILPRDIGSQSKLDGGKVTLL